MMDDTERVEADRVRRAAETRFEIGFEQAAIGAVIADLDGVPIRVNPAVCALLGRPEELLVGRRWTEYTHPDEVPLGQAVLARVAAGHDTYEDERRYLRPDGTVVWASSHVTLVRDESGEPAVLLHAAPGHHRAQADGTGARPPGAARLRSPAFRTGRCSPTAWSTAWPAHGGAARSSA